MPVGHTVGVAVPDLHPSLVLTDAPRSDGQQLAGMVHRPALRSGCALGLTTSGLTRNSELCPELHFTGAKQTQEGKVLTGQEPVSHPGILPAGNLHLAPLVTACHSCECAHFGLCAERLVYRTPS